MDVCLHLGAHRTATQLFQGYLWDNRLALKARGTQYWGPKRLRRGMFAGLLGDSDRYAARTPALRQRSLGRIKMEMAHSAREGVRRLVVSDPNLLGSPRENLRMMSLYGHARKRLSRFAPAFGGARLHIGIGIRSCEHYWASIIANRIVAGRAPLHASELEMIAMQFRSWRGVIEDVAFVFPEAKITVWAYETWGGAPESLLPAMGDAPFVDLKPRRTDPVAKGPSIAELNDALAVLDLPRVDASDTGYMPFTADQQNRLRDSYDQDINWLRAGAGGIADYLLPASVAFKTTRIKSRHARPQRPADRGSYHDRSEERVG